MADDCAMHSQDEFDDDDDGWDDYPDVGCYQDYVLSPTMSTGMCTSAVEDEGEDPEKFVYECLELTDVECLLNEYVSELTSKVLVTPALAKVLLQRSRWQTHDIVDQSRVNFSKLLVDANIKPVHAVLAHSSSLRRSCAVCTNESDGENFRGLSCGHYFCLACWDEHFRTQLNTGISTGIECMETKCRLLVPEDFALAVITDGAYRAKYQRFVFQDHVNSHPSLRFCPGANCRTIIRALDPPSAKRTACKSCSHVFCFACGLDYHAPTDCDTVKQWLVKCADDSETANYITANTKDCPRCHICIEKNGGCNHMQCCKCKHHFCWMCLGDWKSHGSEYYECSRYRENPNIANEAVHVKAREALTKYLHYFERWENHIKSLKLEEALLQRIKDRIDAKISSKQGTWIDWQYLYDAARLLTRCRYTLQYTYPYAYYLEPGSPRKELFEYQQGQLEAEIENLSWKVERAETTDRGDLENQMHIAELKRRTMLKEFVIPILEQVPAEDKPGPSSKKH